MHSPDRLPDAARSSAVLIGTSQYQHPDMPGLPAVANNVDDLASALTDSLTGGLSRDRCAVVREPGGNDWSGRHS